jgi:AhpD family alkylhydroperoxidase
MSKRMNYFEKSHTAIQKLVEAGMAIKKGTLGDTIIDLVDIRAAQMNGCSFCLDMHVKQAKMHGERELRLYHVAAWRDSPLFNDRERLALEWTETLTALKPEGASDELYSRAREAFSEQELSDLTVLVGMINMWTRMNIAVRNEPGTLDKMLGIEKSGLS